MNIDTSLVRKLISQQFPLYANLPIRPVAKSGHDNRTFHLGHDLSVRLPSGEGWASLGSRGRDANQYTSDRRKTVSHDRLWHFRDR